MINNLKNPLPGVPLIESPLFSDFFSPETDSAIYEMATHMREKGYVMIDFPDHEIDQVADRIKAQLTPLYDWESWNIGNGNLRIQDAWQTNEDVKRLAVNKGVIDLLARLYGRGAWPFQTLNFPVGTQQHYHTDSVHFSSMPERFMCGVWIALEDIDLDQGPLIYYPGSHKWPVYTNEHIGHRHMDTFKTGQDVYEDMWRNLVRASKIEPVRLTAKKGQAIIWAANLLHGGDIHLNKDKTRWSQVTHYYFDNCAYYTPLNSDRPAGVIDYRRPFNIVTGEVSENFYVGREISRDFIEATSPTRILTRDFDAAAYLNANPDVEAAGVDAFEHYVRHGQSEGRPLRRF